MISRSFVLVMLAVFLVGCVAGPASAQSDKAPKGIKTKGLVTSLGGFKDTVDMPEFTCPLPGFRPATTAHADDVQESRTASTSTRTSRLAR